MKIFDNRNELAAAILQAGQNCKTNGLVQALDGGNGEYYIQTLLDYGVAPLPDSPDVSTSNTNVAVKLADGILPLGAIVMYSGSTTLIPDGWALCDGGGAPARPDLRGVFVRGALSDGDLNTTGGTDDIVLPTDTGSTTLTADQSGLRSHVHAGEVVNGASSGNLVSGGYDGGGNHYEGNTGDTISGPAIDSHSHTFVYDGSGDNIPAFYALAYIIRTGEIKQVLSAVPPESQADYLGVSGNIQLDAQGGQITIFVVKPAGNITVNIINAPLSSDSAYGASIKMISDGASTVSWGAQFNWTDNAAPALVSLNDEWDWISALTVDQGLTFDGTLSIADLD